MGLIVPEPRPAWTIEEMQDVVRAIDDPRYPHLGSFVDKLIGYLCANEALAGRDTSDCVD